MNKLKLGVKGAKDILTREELRKIGGGNGSGSGSGCSAECSGGDRKYICYDVMCVGARKEVCSFGWPSGYSNCSPA